MQAIWTNDLRLDRLSEQDCEMVRQWRNSEHIRQYMFYQETISPEDQMRWFNALRNDADYYYVITTDKPIGLIHVNDLHDGVGNTGLFIHDRSYWGSPFPVLASLILLNAFFSRDDVHGMMALVRPDNGVSKEYNTQLGFQAMASDKMTIDQSSFVNQVASSSLLQVLCKSNALISIEVDAQDQINYNVNSGPIAMVLHRSV